MPRNILHSLLIIAGASSWYWYKYVYAYLIFGLERYNNIPADDRRLMINISVLVTCVLIALAINSFKTGNTLTNLGLSKKPLTALLLATVCVAPMFIGGAVHSEIRQEAGINSATTVAIWPGFLEELIFRGFITGLLIRQCKWHVVPAILLSAFIFAWGHLYQADTLTGKLLVFLVTSGAGIGFSVFFIMWRWNLWFPIFMHILMNLSFAIFDLGDNVLLSGTANIYRGTTIALGIAASIYMMTKLKKEHSTIHER